MRFFLFLTITLLFLAVGFYIVFAVSNIDPTDKYAWSDITGWLDFYSANNVLVSTSSVAGWANSSVGEVALDCSDTPAGDICAQSDFHVLNSTSTNELSGWGWNDNVGWISFNCLTFPGSCTDSDYKVIVDPASGDFSGWAWSDIAGWISFNCGDIEAGCVDSDYKVNTTWRNVPVVGTLESTIFDTQVTGGSAMNTIMWQGSQPSGSSVLFQIASANCDNGATDPPDCVTDTGWGGSKTSGDGAYVGTDGTSNTYYNPGAPDTQVRINLAHHNNKRYWRYKAIIQTDNERTVSPTVEDIVITWSP